MAGVNYPNGSAIRLNACLAASVVAVLLGWQAVYWLTWDVGQSVGIAVNIDREGDISVDFHGRGVSSKTVRVPLDKKLARGTIEKIDVFGVVFLRGFIPYDEAPGRDSRIVRTIRFHRTLIGDSVIPVLKQYSSLTSLDLRGTRITAAGVRELREALPACKVLR
jgi:hypothetical protein